MVGAAGLSQLDRAALSKTMDATAFRQLGFLAHRSEPTAEAGGTKRLAELVRSCPLLTAQVEGAADKVWTRAVGDGEAPPSAAFKSSSPFGPPDGRPDICPPGDRGRGN